MRYNTNQLPPGDEEIVDAEIIHDEEYKFEIPEGNAGIFYCFGGALIILLLVVIMYEVFRYLLLYSIK